MSAFPQPVPRLFDPVSAADHEAHVPSGSTSSLSSSTPSSDARPDEPPLPDNHDNPHIVMGGPPNPHVTLPAPPQPHATLQVITNPPAGQSSSSSSVSSSGSAPTDQATARIDHAHPATLAVDQELDRDLRLSSAVVCVANGSLGRKRRLEHNAYRVPTKRHTRRPSWFMCLRNAEAWPSGRAGHCLISHGNRIFLYGGCQAAWGSFRAATRGELYSNPQTAAQTSRLEALEFASVYMYSCDSERWRCLSSGELTADEPLPRRHASMVVHSGSLYVYGGFGGDSSVLGDFWEFDIASCRWRVIEPNQPQFVREQPSARAEHSAVVHGNRMVIFGGYDGKRKLNDTFAFDFRSRRWIKPGSAELSPPSRRCKHSAVVVKSKMYVLGGFQFCDGRNFAKTDLHCLDLDSFCWTSVLTTGTAPEALQGHRAVVRGGTMYVLGGKVRAVSDSNRIMTSSGLNKELYSFDFTSSRWSVVKCSGQAPCPRQLHGAVVVPGTSDRWRIVIFGGTDRTKTRFYDDLYELRGVESGRPTDRCGHCDDMGRLINNPKLSDVVFIVEGKRIYAHRVVLYSRSDYFRSMFESGMREERQNEISITDVDYETFSIILQYLYCGNVDVNDGERAVKVLQAADMFRIDGLRAHCVDRVERYLNVDNVAFICRVADQHNEQDLRSFCIHFMVSNFLQCIATAGFHELMSRDAAGLGQEILRAFTEFSSHEARSRP